MNELEVNVVVCVTEVVHVKRMVTCEPRSGCVNWLVMFEWGVVTYEQCVVM